MTPEEFCKKHCYNGHDPNNCHMMEDLQKLLESNKPKVNEGCFAYCPDHSKQDCST